MSKSIPISINLIFNDGWLMYKYLLLTLGLLSCMGNENAGPGPAVSRLGECAKAEAKSSVDLSGKILYSSKDSLVTLLTVAVTCGGGFKEESGFENDSTVKIDWVYSGSTGSECTCIRPDTISVTSSGKDLTRIKVIDFNGGLYLLD